MPLLEAKRCLMLDAGYLINKKERLLVLSSISPRRRLYEPEARDQYLASRDILHPNVPTKPWPRPGMQELNFIAPASLILKRQQLVTITSRQGGLDINFKILTYIDI